MSGKSAGNSHLLRSTAVIGVATLMSRVLGLIRDATVGAVWDKQTTDAFYAAFGVPNFFRRLFAEGTLSSAFVPVFKETLTKEGEEEARRLSAALFRSLTLFLAVVTGLAVVFAPQLMLLLVPGFAHSTDPDKMKLAEDLARICMPFLLFVGLSAIAMAMLNSVGRFFIPALSPAALNVALIAGAAYAVWHAGTAPDGAAIEILAWGVVLGGFLQLAVQMPALWKLGYLTKPWGVLSHPRLWLTVRLAVPAILGLAVYQVNVLVTRWFASHGEGYITYLYYANRIVQFPLGVLAVALATAALPKLSGDALLDERETFTRTLVYALRKTLYIMVPAAVGIAVIAEDAVAVCFNRGSFLADGSLRPTAVAVWFYCIGVPAYALQRVAVSSYYAMKDMKTPLRVAVAAVLANVVLSMLLFGPLQHGGLALATSLAGILNIGLLIVLHRGTLAKGWSWPVWRTGLKVTAASAMMGAASLAVLLIWPAGEAGNTMRLIRLGATVAAGAVLYGGISWFWMRDEFEEVIETLKRRRRRARERTTSR